MSVRSVPDRDGVFRDRRSGEKPIIVAPGEAESGSAGVHPDKEYPGRQRTERCRAPEVQPCLRGLFAFGRRRYASKTHRDPLARRRGFATDFLAWAGLTLGSPFQNRLTSNAFFCRSM